MRYTKADVLELVIIPPGLGTDPENDDVDVEVRFNDGARYGASFFTLRNIETLMEKYRQSGECAHGLYFWADGMIVVRRLSEEIIWDTVEGLLVSNEFDGAFAYYSPADTGEGEYQRMLLEEGDCVG